VLREEGIKEDDELDFDRFEGFLLRFLQHQVLCSYIALAQLGHIYICATPESGV
jgi:hypothetical protein